MSSAVTWRYADTHEYLERVGRMPPVIICCACNGGVQGKPIELLVLVDKNERKIAGENAKALLQNKDLIALFGDCDVSANSSASFT